MNHDFSPEIQYRIAINARLVYDVLNALATGYIEGGFGLMHLQTILTNEPLTTEEQSLAAELCIEIRQHLEETE